MQHSRPNNPAGNPTAISTTRKQNYQFIYIDFWFFLLHLSFPLPSWIASHRRREGKKKKFTVLSPRRVQLTLTLERVQSPWKCNKYPFPCTAPPLFLWLTRLRPGRIRNQIYVQRRVYWQNVGHDSFLLHFSSFSTKCSIHSNHIIALCSQPSSQSPGHTSCSISETTLHTSEHPMMWEVWWWLQIMANLR